MPSHRVQTKELSLVIGDNAANGNHKAGYNGIWDLRSVHDEEPFFVPPYCGMNFEFIAPKAIEDPTEPKDHPTQLSIEGAEVVLHQGPTPTHAVEGRTWGWRERACPFTDEERYEDVIRDRGLERVATIGRSRVTLFKLQDCFDVLAEIFDAGKDGFPPCSGCTIRPRQMDRTVASDWDHANSCLAAESPAQHY